MPQDCPETYASLGTGEIALTGPDGDVTTLTGGVWSDDCVAGVNPDWSDPG